MSKERKTVYVLGADEEVLGVFTSLRAIEKELKKDADSVERDPMILHYTVRKTFYGEQFVFHYWCMKMELNKKGD